MPEFPSQARVVIVVVGIIGCSTAYHVAKLGCPDLLLLERAKLTSHSRNIYVEWLAFGRQYGHGSASKCRDSIGAGGDGCDG